MYILYISLWIPIHDRTEDWVALRVYIYVTVTFNNNNVHVITIDRENSAGETSRRFHRESDLHGVILITTARFSKPSHSRNPSSTLSEDNPVFYYPHAILRCRKKGKNRKGKKRQNKSKTRFNSVPAVPVSLHSRFSHNKHWYFYVRFTVIVLPVVTRLPKPVSSSKWQGAGATKGSHKPVW